MPKLVWQFKLYHLLYLFLLVLSTPLFAVDTDHDGLPDDWEIANGRDPLAVDNIVHSVTIRSGAKMLVIDLFRQEHFML